MQKYKYCTKLHRYEQIVYPLKTAQIKNAQIYILHKTAKIHHRYENLQCTLTRCTKTAKIGNRKKMHKTTPTQSYNYKNLAKEHLLKTAQKRSRKFTNSILFLLHIFAQVYQQNNAQNKERNIKEICKKLNHRSSTQKSKNVHKVKFKKKNQTNKERAKIHYILSNEHKCDTSCMLH